MDTREWFDESTYSDLKIKLSNGTEIKVHKAIVCRANEYFRKLCGPESHFAESKQSIVELKDDDPSALTTVLRHIYKLNAISEPAQIRTWRDWLHLRTTADKYLEPKLSAVADAAFRQVALASTDSDDIFDIVETIDSEMAHDESLVAFGRKIRDNNRGKLLKNDRFREQLESGGREALWSMIDQLVFAADLEQKRHHLCGVHHKLVFQEPSADMDDLDEDDKLVDYCPVCQIEGDRRDPYNWGGYTGNQQYEESTIWISR